ncbi:MAG: serine hydrolase domain-containing protein [Halioglobus sp.]
MSNSAGVSIHGTVAPGFESIRSLYKHNMNTFAEGHTQLCIYHRGEKVVDLWASVEETNTFSADSLVNVFSSGKSLESIALGWLVSQGLLSFEAKIVDYWPEFSANGKEGLTVADLMRHSSGLANFDQSIEPEHLQTANIKENKVGEVIAAQTSRYPGDGANRCEYHAVTRGWVVNEIFRRVDPQQRTIGEFLRQEINEPMAVEALVGIDDQELERVTEVTHAGFGAELIRSMRPKFLGRKAVHGFFNLFRRLAGLLLSNRKSTSRKAPLPYKGMDGILFFNDRSVALGQTPSANTKSSARTLAKIAAMMSAGGKFGGKEYLNSVGWEAVHGKSIPAMMGGLMATRFTQGGVNQFLPCSADSARLEREFQVGREGFFGWMGLGGSIFQWNPEKDIGFGFVVTELHVLDLLNERGKTYQAEVLRCVDKLG